MSELGVKTPDLQEVVEKDSTASAKPLRGETERYSSRCVLPDAENTSAYQNQGVNLHIFLALKIHFVNEACSECPTFSLLPLPSQNQGVPRSTFEVLYEQRESQRRMSSRAKGRPNLVARGNRSALVWAL